MLYPPAARFDALWHAFQHSKGGAGVLFQGQAHAAGVEQMPVAGALRSISLQIVAVFAVGIGLEIVACGEGKLAVHLDVGMRGNDCVFGNVADFQQNLLSGLLLIEAHPVASRHAVGHAHGLGSGKIEGTLVGQRGQELGLFGRYIAHQPVQAAPAHRVVRAGNGPLCAVIQQVKFVIAAHDTPVRGTDVVDHRAVEGHGIDQIAVYYHKIGLDALQLGQNGLEGGQVSVDVGENGQAHGRSGVVVRSKQNCTPIRADRRNRPDKV